MTACTGEPISWPRLEDFARGGSDPAIARHLAACPACRQCLAQIRDDAVALPALVLPAAPVRAARRRWWLAPALAAAAAALAVIAVVRRPAPDDREGRIAIKGVGEVTLALVRDRGGALSFDARRYAPGDRWKVVVSCPPGAQATLAIDVTVADGRTTDRPLAATRLACGNRVVVPGAFEITGDRANRVCAAIAGPDAGGTACVTLRPE